MIDRKSQLVIAFEQLGVPSRNPGGTHDDLKFGIKLCRYREEVTSLLGLALIGLGVDSDTAGRWITKGLDDRLTIGISTWSDFPEFGVAFGILL